MIDVTMISEDHVFSTTKSMNKIEQIAIASFYLLLIFRLITFSQFFNRHRLRQDISIDFPTCHSLT